MSTSHRVTARGYAVIAAVAGLVALVAAIATPFLPVTERTSSFDWPRARASPPTMRRSRRPWRRRPPGGSTSR
nr:hypothetical protein [Gordonia sp. YC-JH1]